MGLGGNKVRKLEFDLAAARADGADCVVSGGVAQSNHARQVAAACAVLGLECHLGIMSGRLAAPEPAYLTNGNILLDRLYGAVLHPVDWNEDRNAPLQAIAEALRAAGRRPYLVPYGASDALGAMGYALAAEEIIGACPDVAWIVHASGSAGTQAGLLAGPAGAAPSGAGDRGGRGRAGRAGGARRAARGREAAALLGVGDRWDDGCVEVAGAWCGPAYGVPDGRTLEAIGLAGRLEGLALDPVYAGKGMAGLIGLARAGRFAGDGAGGVGAYRWRAGAVRVSGGDGEGGGRVKRRGAEPVRVLRTDSAPFGIAGPG